jgi:hypothetical protein
VEPDLDLDPIQPPTPILPRLIAVHLISLVAFVIGAWAIPFPYVFAVIVFTIAVAPLVCAGCAVYLTRLWWSDPMRPRSELFAFLAYGAWVIAVGLRSWRSLAGSASASSSSAGRLWGTSS